jgi:hypothetical protein
MFKFRSLCFKRFFLEVLALKIKKMQNYDSPFTQITYQPEHHLISIYWKNNPLIKDEDFRQEHLQLIKMFKENRPKRYLSNMASSDFVIVPETQEWISALVMRELVGESMFEKVAVIPNQDFFHQLSTEQTVDEILAARKTSLGKLKIQYFESELAAQKWILEEA